MRPGGSPCEGGVFPAPPPWFHSEGWNRALQKGARILNSGCGSLAAMTVRGDEFQQALEAEYQRMTPNCRGEN
jgi:hypothetical protein